MPILKRNVSFAAVLLILGVAPGCTGFFVNPTLSSLAIGPQNQTITANPVQNLQMSATGTYSDGSTKDLTGKVSWTITSSGDQTCASINSTGLVSPNKSVTGSCSATINASFGTITPATTPLTVTQGQPTSIMLTASTTTPAQNSQVTFTAKATFPNSSTQQDITTSVTWVITNTTDLTLTNGSGTGTISATAGIGDAIGVTATFAGVSSNTVTLIVQ
jgi:trimeric autotransporter adhesin